MISRSSLMHAPLPLHHVVEQEQQVHLFLPEKQQKGHAITCSYRLQADGKQNRLIRNEHFKSWQANCTSLSLSLLSSARKMFPLTQNALNSQLSSAVNYKYESKENWLEFTTQSQRESVTRRSRRSGGQRVTPVSFVPKIKSLARREA